MSHPFRGPPASMRVNPDHLRDRVRFMTDASGNPHVSADPALAVAGLVDQFGGPIYGLGLRFCGNAADAEDLVQNVFLEAMRSWASFQGRSSPKTWLYTIAARVCQRMHRRRAGQPARLASLDALRPFDQPHIAALAADQDDAAQIHIRHEAREQVQRAIAALPADFRIPLILKEIVGFPVAQVAEMLGLEPGTVKTRVHRARLRLRADVDAVLPRQPGDAPPAAYPIQVCLDLLAAKQEALDRGVPFEDEVICQRCRSVFATLDLAQQACHDLAQGEMPSGLRERLAGLLRSG